MIAAHNEQHHMVRELLDCGADTEAKCEVSCAPLVLPM